MLGWRVGISCVIVPLLIGLFALDHQAGEKAPYLCGLVILLVARASYEFSELLKTRSFEPSFSVIAICSLNIVAGAWLGQTLDNLPGSLGTAMIAFSVSILVVFLAGMARYEKPGNTMETAGVEILGIAYVGVLLAVTAQLRWVAGAQAGYRVLASLVIATKCGDIGGYTLGRLFGKKKLCPTLSPGKTRMGAFGALIGSSLACAAWLHFGPRIFFDDPTPCPFGWSLLYGASIGVVGLVGDLAESLIKRDVQKKDSAELMPGFGGLLDLLDSVIFAGPVALVLWKLLPLATWQ
jgi:phosphatidate cytidylyltransferase